MFSIFLGDLAVSSQGEWIIGKRHYFTHYTERGSRAIQEKDLDFLLKKMYLTQQ